MDIIILAVIIVICLGGYLAFRHFDKKNKPNIDRSSIAEKTAQDFVNVVDLGDNCLYTVDGLICAYIKIEGVALELYNENDLKLSSNAIAHGLSKIRHPWKYISVSRPVDVQRTLQIYNDLYTHSSGGKRALLKQEMLELAEMVERGDTLERQHYMMIWGKQEHEKPNDINKRAAEIVGIFNEGGIKSQICDKSQIAELCNLVNIPAYVHLENGADFTTTTMAIIRS